tara:strand:+ start:6021 stop:6503 length:483 start_codon:yes stop_codon:yes gene_type:complete
MSTVPQIDENSDNKPEMNGDDDNLVDAILNELNQDSDNGVENREISEPQNNQMQNETVERASLPTNEAAINHEMKTNELPPMMDVEYDSSENSTINIVNLLKKPVIVLCVSFIVFNPLFLNMMRKFIPEFIKNNVFYDQIQTLILAIMTSILFFGTNYLV